MEAHSTVTAMQPVNSRPGFRFEELPSDVFKAIAAGLLGDELVHLSYVNRRLCFDFLTDPAIWTTRAGRHSSSDAAPRRVHDAKCQYMRETSFMFPGMPASSTEETDRGACVPVPTFFRRERRFHRSPRRDAQLLNHPFTLDIWFSVLPSDENGSLVHQTHGSIHHEWRYLHYTQLGTGCISGASAAKPTPEFSGWYPFHGLIDEFRLWKRALDRREVELLAQGLALKIQPVYSLRGCSNIELVGPVQRVRCSRPLEIRCRLRSELV